jgi:peptidoglycan/LPS O-acetylase OafA/YrhL
MIRANTIEKQVRQQSDLLNLLDFCKGLAIALVVLAHYVGGWFGWQGVHIFIVLSGFGLTYSCLRRGKKISWKEWYTKRFKKILPAYWMTCLLGYTVMVGIHLLDGRNLLDALSFPKRLLFFELTLLKNFSYETVVTGPNVSLWFVPFIISFYLAFPWVYKLISQRKTLGGLLIIVSGIALIEFVYRAIAINWLDGSPIGYQSFGYLFPVLGVPLNRLPDISTIPFQGEAAFSLFPARIGEFAVGMLAAMLFFQNRQSVQSVTLNIWAGVLGFLIWIAGNALLYTGFWGWVFADFVIAIGLTLWVINLAALCFRAFPVLFKKLSQLGIWSYYIFLCHFVFIYLFVLDLPERISGNLTPDFYGEVHGLIMVFAIAASLVGTWLTCGLLKKLDQSKLPELLIGQPVTKLFNR